MKMKSTIRLALVVLGLGLALVEVLAPVANVLIFWTGLSVATLAFAWGTEAW